MKKIKKILSGASAAMMAVSAGSVIADEAEVVQITVSDEIAIATDTVSNIKGFFSFEQDTTTPGDRVFNIFGTAVTGICAKPAFAMNAEEADYYVNVGGKMEKSYTVNLKTKQPTTRTVLCACATGPATANVKVTGIPISSVLELTKLDADVNTLKVTGSDGYTSVLPLSYALDKEAMIVYSMDGENMVCGTQFWVPGTVAKYFTRDVVSVEVSAEKTVPEVSGRDEALRAEVALLNSVEGVVSVGQELTFEGYADDLGEPIAAIEFTMDGGKTWTPYATKGAIAEKWVCWKFSYTPDKAGNYTLGVRAKTISGRVSALAANVSFQVSDGHTTL